MIRRLVALFLCLNVFSLQASTGIDTQADLSKAFSDLKFGLEVEWDQQNQDQYKSIVSKFQDQLRDLQKKGLTNDQLVSHIKKNVIDAELGKDLDLLLASVNINKLSPSEASKLAMDHLSKNYAQGSNWRGRGRVAALIAVVSILSVVTAVAILAGASVNIYATAPVCYDEYVCYDYYDTWGFYLYTDCFWETYCY